jgi:hypothetical protein
VTFLGDSDEVFDLREAHAPIVAFANGRRRVRDSPGLAA